MELNEVKPGIRIRTSERLRGTEGMMIRRKYLQARRPGTIGTVKGWVPGHGGDVWWIEHEDGAVAAYCYDEFAPDAKPHIDPDYMAEKVEAAKPWCSLSADDLALGLMRYAVDGEG